MSKYEARLPANDDAIIRRIQSLEAEVRELRAARRLEASTIGRGGITVQGGAIILRDANGNEIARMGAREDLLPSPSGDVQPGFILRRNDGTIAFTLDDPDPNTYGYRQLLKMHDQQGHIIFQEDYVQGWGLSNPTFSHAMSPLTPNLWPGTALGTYQNMLFAQLQVWNPLLDVGIVGTCTKTTPVTSGTIQLLMGGLVVGTLTVPDDGYYEKNFTIDFTTIPGMAPGSVVQLLVQAKRDAGAGSIQANYNWVLGRGSEQIV
ncbi:hypothetical protein ACXJJ3_32755 [Kribbella sp. WER1]